MSKRLFGRKAFSTSIGLESFQFVSCPISNVKDDTKLNEPLNALDSARNALQFYSQLQTESGKVY